MQTADDQAHRWFFLHGDSPCWKKMQLALLNSLFCCFSKMGIATRQAHLHVFFCSYIVCIEIIFTISHLYFCKIIFPSLILMLKQFLQLVFGSSQLRKSHVDPKTQRSFKFANITSFCCQNNRIELEAIQNSC